MADGVKITVEVDLRELEGLESQTVSKLNKGIINASLFLESEIKSAMAGRRPPLPRRVDTGTLMNSIKTSNTGPLNCVVWTNVKYAAFIEFGTTKIKPGHHFSYTAKRIKEDMAMIVAKDTMF
jgi:hypothetical protein